MEQPLGYVPLGELCQIKKAIYELKKSLRAWFDKFTVVVVKDQKQPFQLFCVCVMPIMKVISFRLSIND